MGGIFDAFSDKEIMMIIIAVLVIIVIKILMMFLDSNRENKKYRQKETVAKDRRKRRVITVRMRNNVLERDNYTCQICGISKGLLDSYCPGLGDFLLLEIDHIQPVSKGGVGYEESNLQTLCWRCNRKKSDKKTNEETKRVIDYGVEYLPIESDEQMQTWY